MKRKRSSTSCHQCHKSDKEVIQCNNCTKRYCMGCANKWYPKIEKALFEKCCPICSDICNYGACLQSNRPSNIQDFNGRLEEMYDFSAHVVDVLLPTLKKHAEEAETQDEEVLELLARAEAIVSLNDSTLETRCSCSNNEAQNEASLKAASREDGGNYLYYPVATKIENSDLRHFQAHLSNGEPVIVQGVVPSGPIALSWEPEVMERAILLSLQSSSKSKDRKDEEKNVIHNIFQGYSKGLFHRHGHPKVIAPELRSSKIFREQLPRHCRELVRCLTFKQYTHSVPGVPVNISVSYGPCGGTEQRFFITKLQYGVYDRVSILVHVTSVTSVLNKGQLPVSSDTLQGLEVGTEWHIYRKQDVPKLEEYLHKHTEEMKHISPLRQMVRHDHEDIADYLTMEHRKKLKDEFGIEPCTFMQKLGDAVFVPAGCIYQMRHLKSCIHIAFESLAKSEYLFEGRLSRPSDDLQKEYN